MTASTSQEILSLITFDLTGSSGPLITSNTICTSSKCGNKSMKAKFFVEGIFLTILTIVFQYYLLQATTAANTVDSTFQSYSQQTDPTTMRTIFSTFETQAATYYSAMQITIYLSYVALCFPFRIILIMAFAHKSKRMFKLIDIINIIDLGIFAVFLTRIYYEFTYYRNGLNMSDSADKNGRYYYDNIFRYRNDRNMLGYLYSVGSACLWLRILLLFRLTRFLGPLVKMIQNMMTDIAIFMVLFGIQLIIFASIGTLLFPSISSYESLYESIKTVFGAALGNFDFTTLSSNNKSQYLGDAYLAVIMIINNILLLNLLVAILSSTYALLEDKKMVLYINEILKLRNTLEYDRNCSSLVSSFPPWNVISIILMPLIIIIKRPVHINNILFHLNYLPLFVLVSAAYLASNALLLPVAYIKGVYVTLQQIWTSNQETNIFMRILKFLFFLFFGPVVLVLNSIADTIVFFIHCYQYKMNYRKLFKKSYSVSKGCYYMLQTKFEAEHRRGKDMIDYYQMTTYMRERMEVMEHIQGLIYGQIISINQEVTVDKCLKVIDEFVLVKKILQA